MKLIDGTLLSLICLAQAVSAAGKLHADLAQASQSRARVAVIVRYGGELTDSQIRRAQKLGATLTHRLPSVRSAAFLLDGVKLKDLEKDPDVELIVPDRTVTTQQSTAEARKVLIHGE